MNPVGLDLDAIQDYIRTKHIIPRASKITGITPNQCLGREGSNQLRLFQTNQPQQNWIGVPLIVHTDIGEVQIDAFAPTATINYPKNFFIYQPQQNWYTATA